MAKKPQKRIKHVPQRTCIGCRTVLAKKELVRVVRTPEGVRIDPTGKAAGRGAYVHKIRSCWEQAIKGPINHALKTELTAEDRQNLIEYMSQLSQKESTFDNTATNGTSEQT